MNPARWIAANLVILAGMSVVGLFVTTLLLVLSALGDVAASTALRGILAVIFSLAVLSVVGQIILLSFSELVRFQTRTREAVSPDKQ